MEFLYLCFVVVLFCTVCSGQGEIGPEVIDYDTGYKPTINPLVTKQLTELEEKSLEQFTSIKTSINDFQANANGEIASVKAELHSLRDAVSEIAESVNGISKRISESEVGPESLEEDPIEELFDVVRSANDELTNKIGALEDTVTKLADQVASAKTSANTRIDGFDEKLTGHMSQSSTKLAGITDLMKGLQGKLMMSSLELSKSKSVCQAASVSVQAALSGALSVDEDGDTQLLETLGRVSAAVNAIGTKVEGMKTAEGEDVNRLSEVVQELSESVSDTTDLLERMKVSSSKSAAHLSSTLEGLMVAVGNVASAMEVSLQQIFNNTAKQSHVIAQEMARLETNLNAISVLNQQTLLRKISSLGTDLTTMLKDTNGAYWSNAEELKAHIEDLMVEATSDITANLDSIHKEGLLALRNASAKCPTFDVEAELNTILPNVVTPLETILQDTDKQLVKIQKELSDLAEVNRAKAAKTECATPELMNMISSVYNHTKSIVHGVGHQAGLEDWQENTEKLHSTLLDLDRVVADGFDQLTSRIDETEVSLTSELKSFEAVIRNTSTRTHSTAFISGMPTTRASFPQDCAEIQRSGETKSGIYKIITANSHCYFEVYCDLETDDGGWTIIQRRLDGATDFYRSWSEYKDGFGDVSNEYWLGNDRISRLTNQGDYTLRIDMEDAEGYEKYAQYCPFTMSAEETEYSISLGPYSGNAGDSMESHNHMAFSTYDRDNDNAGGSCAKRYRGGWWYNKCHRANLNGLYLLGDHDSFADGINWYSWRGYTYSLKRTEMKIRPSHFLEEE